jgi:UDP-GlcNAc3NAcA epimerase
MKIVTVLGARPQFIKAGNVSREIAEHDDIQEVIVHTGQHYDANMSDIFFEEMKIPKPDYYLGIGGKSHGAMTGQMMEKIEEVAVKEKPDWILVYGDTNSTLAGALVAAKLRIPLAHVEAGLRSFNMNMPEEVNRILTDRVSHLLFCPTDTAVQNLEKEGFPFKLSFNRSQRILNVGDVMKDGAEFYRKFARKPDIALSDDFILCTVHRAENTDNEEKLRNIFSALETIAEERQVVLPLHPRTRQKLQAVNYISKTKNLRFIDPVGYLEMVWLLDHCSIVMTDSGGLQKEACFFKKPCITLRDETEWVELMENRFNVLAGTERERILDALENFDFNSNYDIDLYGNGRASEKIVKELLNDRKTFSPFATGEGFKYLDKKR